MEKLKVLELFAGIGTQRMALRNIGIDHEVVAIAEIDKYAIKSYEAIHGKTNNLSDVSKIKVEDVPDHDLMTYSFPCTDISLAGKQQGLAENSGTRSSLLWECKRIIEAKKPKYLLMENVKNLVGKKFKPDFDKWLEYLESLGYTNYWQVLNAKDYGIPQNRERVFCVSILGEHEPYEFPEKQPLTIALKDLLEENVDEKFYLSKEIQDRLTINPNFNSDIKKIGTTAPDFRTIGQRDIVYSSEGIMSTLTATDYKQPKQIGEVVHSNIEPLKIKNATKKGYLEAKDGDGVDLAFPDSEARRGRVQKGMSQTLDTAGGNSKGVVIAASRGRYVNGQSGETEQQLEINDSGTTNTITTVQKDNYVVEPKEEFGRMGRQAVETMKENDVYHGDTINPFYKKVSSNNGVSPTLTTRPEGFKTAVSVVDQYRIRKLTPKECWRLMGCSDEDFHKAEQVNSNTQLYKQAGNAIVVDVLEGIFSKLFF